MLSLQAWLYFCAVIMVVESMDLQKHHENIQSVIYSIDHGTALEIDLRAYSFDESQSLTLWTSPFYHKWFPATIKLLIWVANETTNVHSHHYYGSVHVLYGNLQQCIYHPVQGDTPQCKLQSCYYPSSVSWNSSVFIHSLRSVYGAASLHIYRTITNEETEFYVV